eukprot:COSAG03_NODE_19796_length_329_cov_41.552174_1_plen_23_part_01
MSEFWIVWFTDNYQVVVRRLGGG